MISGYPYPSNEFFPKGNTADDLARIKEMDTNQDGKVDIEDVSTSAMS
jgi:hypothetical protein